MFRLWAKEFKENRMIQDLVISNGSPDMNRTKKIFAAIDEVCRAFDLSVPLWLDVNIHDFKHRAKTRFYQDNFVEPIEFDYLEIQVLEEDMF